ncbi:LDH C-terminal domain-like protein [Aspergillus uvarum CBS 121591]|uniref:malate dehydrogenase n=1 Tax=Aspergillus uvarum CBS 121591 TaxID=1448315 RepID=A0A319C2R0_9EURO|nr:LDH C-terminal domain-like protein [Aspergillus uvarum CBS 121591]PYH80286.1 LDH C-terminal domain-like protein [Aspergillus uvarum CBS 121591]
MVKLALIGAAGQIGTPLSLLCKASDLFDEIALYDLVHVPVAAATLQQAGGSAFAAQALKDDMDPTRLRVIVVGGYSGATIVPLYSQAQPPIHADEKPLARLVHRVQFGSDEIVTSKQGAGSAPTCMAYAGFRFVQSVLAGLRGEDVTEDAFVYLPGIDGGREMAEELGVEYFAVRTVLGRDGAIRILAVGNVNEKEKEMLEVAVRELWTNIATGLAFMD